MVIIGHQQTKLYHICREILIHGNMEINNCL